VDGELLFVRQWVCEQACYNVTATNGTDKLTDFGA